MCWEAAMGPAARLGNWCTSSLRPQPFTSNREQHTQSLARPLFLPTHMRVRVHVRAHAPTHAQA